MLNLCKVSKSFNQNGKKIQAVNQLSFEIKEGEIVGFLGNNGSGKTTTIKSICGLIKPDSGTILVNGQNVNTELMEVLKNIAVILEGNRNLNWRLTISENCHYFGTLNHLNKKQIEQIMDEFLGHFDLEEKKHELVGNLSRGMQQKASLIIALLKRPKLLLLDEPFLGLDVASRKRLLSQIRKMAKEDRLAILVTSHQIDYVQEICDKIIILDQGKKLLESSIDSLLDTFMLNVYDIILEGELAERDRVLLSHTTPNLTIDIRENKVYIKVFIGKNDNDLLWCVLDRVKMLGLKLLDVKCGLPELSYAYEQILLKRGEMHA